MRFGIDLGGTKIEIIALTDSGEVKLRQRVSTPQGDYAAPTSLGMANAMLPHVAARVSAAGTGFGVQSPPMTH